jgi:Polyketide cyclase / dehydrase and lipid transport
MPLTVLRDDRIIAGRDAASVWAEVGDVAHLDAWFPVHIVGVLAGEAPAVGNVVFVSHRKHQDPEASIRLRIVEWEAGTRFTCEADNVPGMRHARFEVRVVGEAREAAHVYLGFSGDAIGTTGRLVAFEIARRFRVALRGLADA